MRRRNSILVVSVAVVAAAFAVLLAASWSSHVPITSDLGWWPYQDGLTISQLAVDATPSEIFGLSNQRFRMRYRLAGNVACRKGWKPRIARVQITSRLVCRGSLENPATADVLLVPVVEVSVDENYSGEPVAFNIELEQTFSTMDWGRNVYNVYCLGRTATASVGRYK